MDVADPERIWFEQALSERASDLHIDPTGDEYILRIRSRGALHEIGRLPKREGEVLVQRLKVIARLNIAERRLPQDGQLTYEAGSGKTHQVRIATLPTVRGEKVTLRFIYSIPVFDNLLDLGMPEQDEKVVRTWLASGSGMIVSAGPTGSGKTTTIYALLSLIDRQAKSVYSIEDPVEVNMPLVNQIDVNEEIGLTFEMGLRALLRHDPDIIVIGEIRDRQTAEIAVRAGLSGHLVLSTIHAYDAIAGIVRFFELGIEAYLVTAALRGVIGQQMGMTRCPACHGDGEGCSRCRGMGEVTRPQFDLYTPEADHLPYLLKRDTEALREHLKQKEKVQSY
ncbi:MAG: Flp pilus assembly complex ATPase component TadA [Candidatus Carbobacillus altaicus]|nr:Flp pilus assembly complex ATPase component TadA [Candidatus Carbobacillus altaicus]